MLVKYEEVAKQTYLIYCLYIVKEALNINKFADINPTFNAVNVQHKVSLFIGCSLWTQIIHEISQFNALFKE